MKLPGEEEVEGGMGPAMIYMVIGVSAFVLIVLFAVLKGNDHKASGSEAAREAQKQQEIYDRIDGLMKVSPESANAFIQAMKQANVI